MKRRRNKNGTSASVFGASLSTAGRPLPAPSAPTKADVRRWMVRNAQEVALDHGEINLTKLAEAAADHFDADAWLDDEQHFVWEAAIEASELAS